MMAQKEKRVGLRHLREHLVCVLCGGYLIDATTIVECLHSFCKTCIVRYLDSSKFCPICDVQVHKTKPLVNIRMDHTLQDMVYKLVPGLFQEEMKRRREFYKENTEEEENDGPWPEYYIDDDGEVQRERVIFSNDEQISLCLQLSTDGKPPKSPDKREQKGSNEIADCRYLLCPAAVTVSHLKKFIRLKFNLGDRYQIDMYHTDESLQDHFTLMDIAYIYAWRRKGPLRLFYTIYSNPAKKLKRTASSTVTSELPKSTTIVEMQCSAMSVHSSNQSTEKLMSSKSLENNRKIERCHSTTEIREKPVESPIIQNYTKLERSQSVVESRESSIVAKPSAKPSEDKETNKMKPPPETKETTVSSSATTCHQAEPRPSSVEINLENNNEIKQKECEVVSNGVKEQTKQVEKLVIEYKPKENTTKECNANIVTSSSDKEKTVKKTIVEVPKKSESVSPTINIPTPHKSFLVGIKPKEKNEKKSTDTTTLLKPKSKFLSLPVKVPEPPLSIPKLKPSENVSKPAIVPKSPNVTNTQHKPVIKTVNLNTSMVNKSCLSNSSSGIHKTLNSHDKRNGEKRPANGEGASNDIKKSKYNIEPTTSKNNSFRNGRDNLISKHVSVPYIAKPPTSHVASSYMGSDKSRKLLQVPERPFYVPFAHGQGLNMFPYRAHVQDYGNDIPQDLSMKKKPNVDNEAKSSNEKQVNGTSENGKIGAIDKYAFTDDDDAPVTSRKMQHVKSEPMTMN